MVQILQTYPAIGFDILGRVITNVYAEDQYLRDMNAQCTPNPPPFVSFSRTVPDKWEYSQQLLPIIARQLPNFPHPVSIPIPEVDVQDQPSLNSNNLDRRSFWNLLVTVIPQSSFKPPEGRETRVLDVGCGAALASIPLHTYFGKSPPGTRGKSVSYLGIDNKEKKIKQARKVNPMGDELEFAVADATTFDKFPQLKGRFDVIVIRNQDVGGDTPLWNKIFKESLDHLEKGGILLITSSSCFEHEIALKQFRTLGGKVQLSGQNPFARREFGEEGTYLQLRDQYVAVIKK